MHLRSLCSLLFIGLIATSVVACDSPEPEQEESPGEEQAELGDDMVEEAADEADKVEPDPGQWSFEVEPNEETPDPTFEFQGYRDGDLVVERVAYEEGGSRDLPTVGDHYGTEFCGRPAIVVTLESAISTGISTGTSFNNVVIDHESAEVLGVLSASEIVDREDGSVISDDQDETEELLRGSVDEDNEDFCDEEVGTSFWAD